MGIPLAHDVFIAGTFMDRVANRISGGNFQFAQQKHSRSGEVFTMPFARVQEKTAKEGVIRVGLPARLLPGAITELLRKKTADGLEGIWILVAQMEL